MRQASREEQNLAHRRVAGLRVAEHFGSFFQRNITDLEFGNMDADKAIGAHIKHESKLDDKFDAYFQCALLYTTSDGERRVRCHNLAVPVTNVMGNVFLRADMDTTITFLAKQCPSSPLVGSKRRADGGERQTSPWLCKNRCGTCGRR